MKDKENNFEFVILKDYFDTNTKQQMNKTEQEPESVSVSVSAKQSLLDNDFYTNKATIRENCRIMVGELLIDYIKASFKPFGNAYFGILALTDYRLIFCFNNNQQVINELNIDADYFNMSLFQIEKASKSQDKESGCIDVMMKDTRVIRFHIWEKESKIIEAINQVCNPKDKSAYFAYSTEYLVNIAEDPGYFHGWELYDPIQEFQRQGVEETNKLNLRYCYANKDFALCQTYPEFLIVHAGMNDDNLREASKHRTKNRLPVLTYYYGRGEKTAQTGYPSLWRSSQTKSGITGTNKSNMDILLLETITGLSNKLYIFDARPFINALANRVNGGGYENVNHYTNAEIIFCDIDNIHAVRNSLNKVNQLCKGTKVMDNQKFWSSLEATNWYFFVHLLLKYSTEITLKLLDNCAVLTHCSDGWDRTSQLVSLSQLLIEPFYRTILGFGVLLEKDWLSFGHQFGIRNGIYMKEPKEDQCSPIFLQFLDCVHQLLSQFPNAFEFNDTFLVFLAYSINSNLYGTFMFNSDYERLQMNAKTKTASIWSDVIKYIHQYINPYYQSNPPIEVLQPKYSPCSLAFWSEFFMHYDMSLDYTPITSTDSNNKTKTFKTNAEFFIHHMKQMDTQAKQRYVSLEEEYNKLKAFVLEVQDKTGDDSHLKELNDKAKEFLKQ